MHEVHASYDDGEIYISMENAGVVTEWSITTEEAMLLSLELAQAIREKLEAAR